ATPAAPPSFDARRIQADGIQADGLAGADSQNNPGLGAGSQAPQGDVASFDPGDFTPPGFDPHVAASPAAGQSQTQAPEDTGMGLPAGPAFSAAAPIDAADSGNVATDTDVAPHGSVATMGMPTAATP